MTPWGQVFTPSTRPCLWCHVNTVPKRSVEGSANTLHLVEKVLQGESRSHVPGIQGWNLKASFLVYTLTLGWINSKQTVWSKLSYVFVQKNTEMLRNFHWIHRHWMSVSCWAGHSRPQAWCVGAGWMWCEGSFLWAGTAQSVWWKLRTKSQIWLRLHDTDSSKESDWWESLRSEGCSSDTTVKI